MTTASRRLRTLEVSPDFLASMFREPTGAECFKDRLPDDAWITHAFINPRGNVVLHVASDEFPELVEGEEPPPIEPCYRRVPTAMESAALPFQLPTN